MFLLNLTQNIVNIYLLDHLVKQNINNIYFCIFGGPQIKFFLQFSNFQMVNS